MFCQTCSNFMDITNNIIQIDKQEGGNAIDNIDENDNIDDNNDIESDDDVKGMVGGKKDNTNNVVKDDDLIEEIDDDESSSYDVNSDSRIINLDIDNFLKDKYIQTNLKNINELFKAPILSKYSSNQKTIIINKILDANPEIKNTIKQNKKDSTNNQGQNKTSYYYCKNCGHNEKIPNSTFIFSRGNEKNDNKINYKFLLYKNDNTKPFSRKYTCINKNCKTHKNPEIKKAVFFSNSGTYSKKYICTICESFWDTNIVA